MRSLSIKLVRHLTVIILLSVCAAAFAGCGFLLDGIEEGDAEYFVTSTLDEFFDSGCSTDLNSMADKAYDMSEINDEQLELFRYSLRNVSYEVVSTKIKDERDTAVCIVEFTGIPRALDLDKTPVTVEDYKKAIDGLKKTRERITFRLVKDESGSWMFSDLNDFYDSLLRPYDGLEYLNDKGVPAHISDDYLKPYIVDNMWYDPLLGNPVKDLSISKPSALINVFCFSRKMTVDITAKLYRGTTEIAAMDVALDDDIMVKFDFDAMIYTQNEYFRDGRYHVELYAGDVRLAESSEITVR